MKQITVEVPYPDGSLLQNSRKHWRVKGEATADARMVAKNRANLANGTQRWNGVVKLEAVTTIYPPDKRRRDTMNTAAALKPAIDGIFDALGVDDSLIDDWRVRRREPIPGGRVIITIQEVLS
jgi:crossover junction endodeoxyribonuclease RusA